MMRPEERTGTGCVAVGVLLGMLVLAGSCLAQADALAGYVLGQTGRSKGVACVARCGDGALAAAIAEQSGMVVLGLDASEGNVAAARARANGAGLLGRRVYVLNGAITHMPFADNCADLLVLDSITDAGLTGIVQQEILRVLTPCHGTAFIGAQSGGVSRSALQTWADGFGVPGVSVTDDANGVWARITKPPLPGADDWQQRYHGPGNNVVSTDTALQFPFLTQWMGKPFHDISYNSEVHVANGRILTMGKLWSGGYAYPIRMNTFYMRNAYNGEILWTRNLPLRYLTGFGAAVMQGDSVFVMVGDSVAVLDAETGAIRYRIGFTGLTGGIRRIAILDDILVVLAGEPDMSADFPDAVTDKMLVDSVFYGGHPELDRHPPHSWGTELAAYDLSARQSLWHHVESTPIDLNHLALSEGRAVFYARNSRAAALDLRTGAEEWQNNSSGFLSAVAVDSSIVPSGYDAIDGINAQCNLLAHDGRVFIATGRSDSIVALSLDNGDMLWCVPNGIRDSWLSGSPYAQMVVGDTLYHRDVLLDAATGATLSPYGGSAPGCGVFTYAPGTVYGQLGISYDLEAGEATPGLSGLHHAVCDLGSFVANGLYITSSFKCRCSMPSRGYKVMGSAGEYQHNQAAVQSERLLQSANLDVASPLAVTSQDWFACRGNNQRTGSSTVPVSSAPNRRFTFTPDVLYYTDFAEATCTYGVDLRVTPPVAVGDYVFIGGWDGKVRCINSATSQLEWQFECGGAVASPPTVTDGRTFFGSCDGYAYAVEARTGRLLWRFRAAPAQRMIMQHGMLMSTWPVTGGVLVHDGVAYCAAGNVNAENGTHVYALDAATGEIVWQNNTLAALPDVQNAGRTASGGMAIAGGRLWLSTANRATFSLQLADGTLVPGACDDENWPGKGQGQPGADIGVFRDRFIVYGGRPFWSDHSERWGTEEFESVLRYAIFSCIELDGSGNALYPEVTPYAEQTGVVTPAWDNDLMVLATDRVTGVCGWDAASADTFLTQNRIANESTNYGALASRVVNTEWTPRWGPLDIRVSAFAVAANAVIVAYHDNNNANWGDWKEKLLATTWKVGLFDKASGALLWSDTLPVEPLRNGLCVDRSGNILVALRDGRMVCFGGGPVHVAGTPGQSLVEPRESTPATVSPWARTTGPASSLPADARRRVGAGSGQPSRSVAAGAPVDTRPLWQVASDPAVVPGSVVLGSASADSAIDPSEHGGEHDMAWHPERPTVPVAHAYASSSAALHGPENAIDRDLRTRWSPVQPGADTLTLDLGSATTVSAVSLVWYARNNHRVPLTVLVSPDGERFVEIDNGHLRGAGTNTTLRSFLPERARFVRVAVGSDDPVTACHIFEVAVHEEPAAMAGKDIVTR